jgi:hypothetical protein
MSLLSLLQLSHLVQLPPWPWHVVISHSDQSDYDEHPNYDEHSLLDESDSDI